MEDAPGERSLRPFAYGLAGAVIGAGLLLLAYDRFVVAPREAQRQAQVQVDLAEGRTEAQKIAGELQQSVDRSLEQARAGFADLSADQDRTRLVNDALARGSMYRVAVTEAYMSNGTWPASAAEAGLPKYDGGASGAVKDIVVGAGGTITVVLREPFADGRFVLAPRAGTDGTVSWSCRSEGLADLARLAPACKP